MFTQLHSLAFSWRFFGLGSEVALLSFYSFSESRTHLRVSFIFSEKKKAIDQKSVAFSFTLVFMSCSTDRLLL